MITHVKKSEMSTNQQKNQSKMEMYLGSRYNDIYDLSHGEFCHDLQKNKPLVQKIIHSKVFGKKPIEEKTRNKHTVYKYSSPCGDSENYEYRIADVDGEPKPNSNEIPVGKLENVSLIWIRDIAIDKMVMGYPLMKKWYNGYSSRLGSVDLYCSYEVFSYMSIKIGDAYHMVYDFIPEYYINYVTPFKIDITVSSLSVIARDIEFYRKTLKSIEKDVTVLPIFIGPQEINTTQFDSVTFDDIKKWRQTTLE